MAKGGKGDGFQWRSFIRKPTADNYSPRLQWGKIIRKREKEGEESEESRRAKEAEGGCNNEST